MQSKRYKANRHSQPPWSIWENIKNGFQEHISPGHQREGEVTCIKIECSLLLFIVRYGNEEFFYLLIKIYFCPFFFLLYYYYFFFFNKSLHTTQSTPHSSLHHGQRSLLASSSVALPRSRDTLLTKKTAPVKKDLHATSFRFSLPGDEVANNRGIDSLNVSLMSYVVGAGCAARRDTDVGVVKTPSRKKRICKPFIGCICFLNSTTMFVFFFPFFNIQTFKTWNKKKNKKKIRKE